MLSSLSNIIASGALSSPSTQPSGFKLKADHCSPAVSDALSAAVESVFRLLLPGIAEGERPAVFKTDMLSKTFASALVQQQYRVP